MGRQATQAYFDRMAPQYETNKRAVWYQAQAGLVMDLIAAEPPPARVLDIGSGTGFLLRRMAQRQPGVEAVGIDLSAGMVNQARLQNAAPDRGALQFRQMDWEQPGSDPALAESSFDLVTCLSCLHYFTAPEAALRRMLAMLRPGGRVMLVDRATDGSPATALLGLVHRHVWRDGIRFHSTAAIRGFATAAGFVEATTAARVRQVGWHGKLVTSIAVISARRPW